METSPKDLQFPFNITAAGKDQEQGSINAADSHLLEVQSVLGPQEDKSGNVLAVINLDGEFEQGRCCTGKRWQTLQIRMNHEKLLGLDSRKITDMFQPARQQRTRRRLGFTPLPPGIDYVLDFTPPAEGPELADLTAALWLPRTVKVWFLAGQYLPEKLLNTDHTGLENRPLGDKAVGAMMALGHDDVCKNESCLVDLNLWQVNPSVPGIFEEDAYAPGPKHIPLWRKVEDYCRIRHRAAIMRVLRAVNGEGLLLNSATRMWTVAQVAIHLEVPRVVVDPVTQWLIAPPNTKFIEICPEKAFQLAHALRIPSVLIASFKLLVGELAVDFAATEPSPRRPPLTWIQRRRDDYGDFPSDPVEYAARAFVDRITDILAMLVSDDALSKLGSTLPEWEKLRSLDAIVMWLSDGPGTLPHQLKTSYLKLVRALAAVFKRRVTDTLMTTLSGHTLNLIEAQRSHHVPPGERIPAPILYEGLSDNQKALTPMFWDALRNRTGPHSSFSESTYMGKQLWRIAKDFNENLDKAKSKGLIKPDQIIHGSPEPTPFFVNTGFSLFAFVGESDAALRRLCDSVLDRRSNGNDSAVPFFLSDHLLLSLDERELNFLPIWADGLDDGSGGVFQEVIPPAEMGPSEPGPAYHTGYTVGTDASTTTMTGCGSTVACSDLGIGNLGIYSDVGSAARSMDAQQSVTTGPARGRVVAGSESIDSEAFSTADHEYADAMFALPAEHQGLGKTVARYVEDFSEADSILDRSEDQDEMAWSTVESVTGAEILGGETTAAVSSVGGDQAESSTTSAAAAAIAPSSATRHEVGGLDGFGLENDEDMDDFDDGTSTLDGSDYDLI